MNIQDVSALERTAVWLDELIQACRKGGLVHSANPKLTTEVTRKAKGLRTSIMALREHVIPSQKGE
jgi:hypothetical protein